MASLWLVRGAVALVWLYQGLWCKLLRRAPRHEAIVGNVPFVNGKPLLPLLGGLECLLAVWVISGVWQWPVAMAQTVLLVAMNAGGIAWARPMIPDPAGMVIQNVAFLTLVWETQIRG